MSRRLANYYPQLGLVAAALALPILVGDYPTHVMVVSLYYVIMAASWNLLAGYTAIFSLAHHAFAGISAYVSALSVLNLKIPIPLGILLGIAVSTALSYVMAITTLKMRGIYLALTTWAFAEIVRLIIAIEYGITRGDLGLQTPLLYGTLLPIPYYYTLLVIAAVILLVLRRMINSKIGLYLKSIRDEQIAAATSGVEIYKWKKFAFTISGAIAGFAGAIFYHYIGILSPVVIGFSEMATIIMMVIVGGFGTFLGPIIGAVTIEIFFETFRIYREWRLVVFAITVILVVKFYREGLAGMIRKYWPKIVS